MGPNSVHLVALITMFGKYPCGFQVMIPPRKCDAAAWLVKVAKTNQKIKVGAIALPTQELQLQQTDFSCNRELVVTSSSCFFSLLFPSTRDVNRIPGQFTQLEYCCQKTATKLKRFIRIRENRSRNFILRGVHAVILWLLPKTKPISHVLT